jgi:hypothetical protein
MKSARLLAVVLGLCAVGTVVATRGKNKTESLGDVPDCSVFQITGSVDPLSVGYYATNGQSLENMWTFGLLNENTPGEGQYVHYVVSGMFVLLACQQLSS